MEDWAEIRRLHRSEHMAVKAIARRFGLARNTVRSALASDTPPKYERAPQGSRVDEFEPAIRRLLAQFPDMPATVIAERIGWVHSSSVLRARIALLRPLFSPPDPADRTTYAAGEIVQCDLWFPGKVVPVAPKVFADPPVLTMVAAYSGFMMALLLPSRMTGDLVAGMWQLLAGLGGVPKMLVWDNESGIGQHRRLTMGARSFAGTLGTRIYQAAPRDPETKGVVERADVAKREGTKKGYQRGRRPDPGEQPAHPTMAQQVHVIDRVRPGNHPRNQRRDLQVRVHTTDGLQGQRVRDEVSQARPLRQRHRRSQTRTRHEIGIVERCGDGRETMRNSYSANALLSG